MMETYWGTTFFGFFQTLLHHIILAFQGKYTELASDEIQLITLILLGISSAIVGSFLVVRKMTMVANAISHTVLLGIVTSFLFFHFLLNKSFHELLQMDLKLLLFSAFLSSLLTMLLTDFFHHGFKIRKKCKHRAFVYISILFRHHLGDNFYKKYPHWSRSHHGKR